MKAFQQKFEISHSKPIEINLLGGTFEINTHDISTVELDAGQSRDLAIVPEIKDAGDRITISGQSFTSFLPQNEKVVVKLKVPAGSKVYIELTGGVFSLTGDYSDVSLQVSAGTIKIDLALFSLKNLADINLLAGDIRFYNSSILPIQIEKQTGRQIRFKTNSGGTVLAKVSLGEVKLK